MLPLDTEIAPHTLAVVATHYDVLGVRPDAPPEDVRRAYLDRARELHPDRTATRSKTDAERAARGMQEVNEAWRILRDPTSRAAYDRALQPVEDEDEDVDDLDRPFHAPLAEPGDLGVSLARAIPWVAILTVLFAIFVFTAFAGGDRTDDAADDLVGRCVVTGSASSVRPVPCDGPNEGQVVLIVDQASLCPRDSTPQAIEGDRWLCLQ